MLTWADALCCPHDVQHDVLMGVPPTWRMRLKPSSASSGAFRTNVATFCPNDTSLKDSWVCSVQLRVVLFSSKSAEDGEWLHAFVTSFQDYRDSGTLQGPRWSHLFYTRFSALSACRVKNSKLKSSSHRFKVFQDVISGSLSRRLQRSSQHGDSWALTSQHLLMSSDEQKLFPLLSILNARCFHNKGKSIRECPFLPRGRAPARSSGNLALHLSCWRLSELWGCIWFFFFFFLRNSISG